MTSRRKFIAATALGAAAVASAGAAHAAGPRIDKNQLVALLNSPARHRQVWAMTNLSGAVVLNYMTNSMNAFQFDYGEGEGALHVAAVIYGPGLVLGLDSDAWRRFHFAEMIRDNGDRIDPRVKVEMGNVFIGPKPGLSATVPPNDPNSSFHDDSVTGVLKRGGSFFLCNNALTKLAGVLSRGQYGGGKDPGAVHADLLAHVLPGVHVVPAGVAALVTAQEQHFTLAQVLG